MVGHYDVSARVVVHPTVQLGHLGREVCAVGADGEPRDVPGAEVGQHRAGHVDHVADTHGAGGLAAKAGIHAVQQVETRLEQLRRHVLRLDVEGRRIPNNVPTPCRGSEVGDLCSVGAAQRRLQAVVQVPRQAGGGFWAGALQEALHEPRVGGVRKCAIARCAHGFRRAGSQRVVLVHVLVVNAVDEVSVAHVVVVHEHHVHLPHRGRGVVAQSLAPVRLGPVTTTLPNHRAVVVN
mmetsp:Transcript_9498/g.22475  ORF Transcript_9498/g.22475 Transcript_9498/m.22475 type:complete len:236 (+) Transcript_9498:1687-2394(+)